MKFTPKFIFTGLLIKWGLTEIAKKVFHFIFCPKVSKLLSVPGT